MKRMMLGLIVAVLVIPCSFPGLAGPVQAQGIPNVGGPPEAAMGSQTQNFAFGNPVPFGESQPGPAVDIGFFYDRLAPYGDWRQHPAWGWVWSPRGVPVDWRPYTYGHWVYTDEYGWLWESDEPWGWACFHYGRWAWDDQFGWFWVPGSYWGPCWVAWRTGPGVFGWCPLPPPVRWRAGFGLEFDGFNLDLLPTWEWVFVDAAYFDAPRLYDYVFLPSRNIVFLRETRPIIRFESVNGRIVNRAFSAGQIEAFTHRRVTHFRVRHVESPSAMRLARERDGEVSVFNPRIARGPAGLTPPGPGELERRQRAERSQLQEQQRAEQARQQQRQRTERTTPRGGAQELQRRQEAERQALQGEHQRQRQTLENRQMRERQESRGPQARAREFARPEARAQEPARPEARANESARPPARAHEPEGAGRFGGVPEARGREMRR